MNLFVIRRPSAWASLQELEAAGAKSAKVAKEQMSGTVSWIRSYVVHEPDGRIGTFCIYEAKDGEAIRDHAKRVGMPGEEFYPITDTVILERSDDSGGATSSRSSRGNARQRHPTASKTPRRLERYSHPRAAIPREWRNQCFTT